MLTIGYPWRSGSAYSPPSPDVHSPDTTSSIYPERPIRPLPKRPLRSRLSPELADSILYPPAPAISKPLFFQPPSETGFYENGVNTKVPEIDKVLIEAQNGVNGDGKHGYQFKGNDLDSDDEDGLGIGRYVTQRAVYVNGSSGRDESIAQSASSNDSVDGYDSFENTNNKKKRKIPTSGSLGNHHTSLSAELANMGISSSREGDLATQVSSDSGTGQYYTSPSSAISGSVSGTGISGAGRGRYGRSGARNASGRSPLGVSMNGSNAWQAGRAGNQRRKCMPSGATAAKGKLDWEEQERELILEQVLNSLQNLASSLRPLQTQRRYQRHLLRDKRT